MVSPTGEKNSIKIKQDIKLYKSVLDKNDSFKYKVKNERHAWVQIVKGNLNINYDILLEQGDGLAFSEGDIISFATKNSECEFLVFDLC